MKNTFSYWNKADEQLSFFLFFFFVRQTFSAPRKGCLGELAASWGGRRRFAYPLSQPWTHLMLLCRGRAKCCIFLFPLLCSGQLPCPGAQGWQAEVAMGTAALPFLVSTQLRHSWHGVGDSPQSHTALVAHTRLGCALGHGIIGLSVQRLTQEAV